MKRTLLALPRSRSGPVRLWFLLSALALAGRPAAAADWVSLFNGTNLHGWRAPTGDWQAVGGVTLDPADPRRFQVSPGAGVLLNGAGGHTVNLLTAGEWGDVEAELEFCIPRGSNSGVYFMGRYEIQVYDSYGAERGAYPGIECGGIYPRWTAGRGEFEGHSPRVNASRPPGEWQRFEVVFRAPRFDADGRKVRNACFVRVVHNGRLIHENVELTGPTRAAIREDPKDEKPAGPLMLQGDHGPVAWRLLRVRAVQLP